MIESCITLRDAEPKDLPFLARLYTDTRRREVGEWGWNAEQQQLFLRMQFDAQCRSYRAAFPDAADRIVCLGSDTVGRMLVRRQSSGIRLIDIALLEEHRNRRIGTGLLRALQQECEVRGGTLRLQVLNGNPAIRLYDRLGFVQSSAGPMYIEMEWIPARQRERL